LGSIRKARREVALRKQPDAEHLIASSKIDTDAQ
jgi:hypothetical protein